MVSCFLAITHPHLSIDLSPLPTGCCMPHQVTDTTTHFQLPSDASLAAASCQVPSASSACFSVA